MQVGRLERGSGAAGQGLHLVDQLGNAIDLVGDQPGQCLIPLAQLAAERLGGTAVHPGHDDVVDVVCRDAGGLQACLPGIGAERDVAGLAEAFLPCPGPAVAGGPPPVEELVAQRGASQVFGDDRGARPVVPDDNGGGGVTPCGLIGRSGKAVAQVRHHHQGRA